MTGLYNEQILEHAKYPSNFGTLDNATVSHEELNPLCGDRIQIDVLLENDIIAAIRFSGQGCAISMAAASLLTEAVEGLTLTEARAFDKEALLALIGLPLQHNPVRIKCALLALKAFKMCLYHEELPGNDALA